MKKVAVFVIGILLLGAVNSAEACVDNVPPSPPLTVVVDTAYGEICITVHNLSIFGGTTGQSCSCGLHSWTSIFTNIFYVAFTDSTGVNLPGFAPWVPRSAASNSWDAAYIGFGWEGFVADVVATLPAGTPAELVIYASLPPGYTLSVVDTSLRASQLGADEWDAAGDSLANSNQSVGSFSLSSINISEVNDIILPPGILPEISTTTPNDGATGVLRDAPIVIGFSKQMDTLSVGYIITPDPGRVVHTWSPAGNTITITHDPFDSTTIYSVDVQSGQDLFGNNLEAGGTPNPFSFTTGMTLGILERDVELLPLRMLPNPASDLVHVSVEHNGPVVYHILDLLGRVIDTQGGNARSEWLDTRKLKAGSYIVLAITPEGKALARNKLVISK